MTPFADLSTRCPSTDLEHRWIKGVLPVIIRCALKVKWLWQPSRRPLECESLMQIQVRKTEGTDADSRLNTHHVKFSYHSTRIPQAHQRRYFCHYSDVDETYDKKRHDDVIQTSIILHIAFTQRNQQDRKAHWDRFPVLKQPLVIIFCFITEGRGILNIIHSCAHCEGYSSNWPSNLIIEQ